MKSSEYWEKAALLREIAVQAGATFTAEEVLKLYDTALDDINTEIQKIKVNFQRRYGLDNETASYFLTQAQQEENLNSLIYALENAPTEKQRKNILEFIHRDGLSVRAYASRIERYKAVKQSIYARLKKLAAEETGLVTAMLKKAYSESYYGNIDDTAKGLDVGINFGILNDRAITEAVTAKWHGKRFSDRIWDNTDKLAQEAQELVTRSLMSGESLSKTAQKLSARFQAEKYHATTLVHTETAHIHAMADMQAYKDLGIEEYRYLATLDYLTCETCQPLDGKVFKLSEAREGINYPTMHPRCRCTTTMNIDINSRRARNPATGRNEIIDGSTTYSEWVRGLTPEQKSALELSQKKNSNRTADKLQFAEYKNRLGTKVVGRSFDKWQEMKYTEKEKYKFIQLDYRRQNKLVRHPELILPNAKKAMADDRKFTEYLFNPENQKGWAKGKAFTSRLGYDKDNYAELKDEIMKSVTKYPSTYKDTDKYGDKYEQRIILYGNNGTPANVVIGWKVKDKETWMTSAYIKEVDE